MKRFNEKRRGLWVLVALLAMGAGLMTSCKDTIDDSSMYTFTGQMATDYLEDESNNGDFSLYLELLNRVKPGKHSSSTMAALLRARGHYTCFAPNNAAVQTYLDSLVSVGELSTATVSALTDSVAQDLVFNSLIDSENGDAFMSTLFEEGVLASNMNDRPMTISFDTISGGQSAIFVNTKSRIITKDIEVENGYIHVVDHVIAPSNDMVGGLISGTENTKVFGALLTYTGWADSMARYRDEVYEENHPETQKGVGSEAEIFKCPEHKYYGYTCFVETDEVMSAYGIHYDENNPTACIEQLKQVLINMGVYSDATTDNNYQSTSNIINQFVAYHLLPERIAYNQLAIHYNETGYNRAAYSINVFDYYETLGPWRRMMKITSGPNTGGFRINRYAKMNKTTYKEDPIPTAGSEDEGILISSTNVNEATGKSYENGALNGYYYPINKLLVYDSRVPNKVLNERMRFDFCSFIPEMMTNNLRRPMQNASNISFPDNYFDNVWYTYPTSNFTYLPGLNSSWQNYQGDEFNIVGKYDFTVKLPPVPNAGTYEVRLACNNNSDVRSMAQFYIGTDRTNLAAVGVPIDLRIKGTAFVNLTGFATDVADDELNEENDKLMRLNGYMKAPKSFVPVIGDGVTNSARTKQTVFRKIVYTGTFDPQKTYYMRFKSVLESETLQFVLDYIEFCPSAIYNNPADSEDRW